MRIGGVDGDGVMDVDSDIKVFIEITEERSLQKVRDDIIKLRTAKAALAAETGAFARCFCIVNGTVTSGMIDAGTPHSIKVLSFDEFSRIFFDFASYRTARERISFGSAVNPLTGKKDDSQYVPVHYVIDGTTRELDIAQISDLLRNGKRIVLIGEYGSGKSRCLRELFRALATTAAAHERYPIAIDLREAWGVKRGLELLRRHLEDIGADDLQKATIRVVSTGLSILLFDGFDELGSQAWSNDADKLRTIRAKSLEGVKDLIGRTQGGIIVSGREHYFNNNNEMFQALGLDPDKTVVLRSKNEFTEIETAEYFKRLQSEIVIPDWLPRRPLICQTISELSTDELDDMFSLGGNEIEFWAHFLKVLCARDARIHVSFDADAIEKVLIQLGRITRTRPGNVGPITLSDVQAAFQSVVGQTPVEDAAVMLQRLPGLGRVKAESNDRQFIDLYILDGLRGKDIADTLRADEVARRMTLSIPFANPLDDLGQRILAYYAKGREGDLLQLAKRASGAGNTIMACDIIASLLRMGQDQIDFQKLGIDEGHFLRFDMSETLPLNLEIRNSVFGVLVLPSAPPPGTTIVQSLAERVFGVAGGAALPKWVSGLTADRFDSVESVSRIRQIGLKPEQEVLVAIVRKTFFQKGAGRKEEALRRGLGRIATSAVVEKVLNILLHDNIISRFKGDEGWVYTPNRNVAGRMKKMLYELRVSSDPIWVEVSGLS